jgi:hypothetical protein
VVTDLVQTLALLVQRWSAIILASVEQSNGLLCYCPALIKSAQRSAIGSDIQVMLAKRFCVTVGQSRFPRERRLTVSHGHSQGVSTMSVIPIKLTGCKFSIVQMRLDAAQREGDRIRREQCAEKMCETSSQNMAQ